MGRRRGSTAFPVARIKKMMQSDDDVGKIATATPVLVAKALECMMEDVLRDAAAVALGRRTKTVTPQHLKHSVTQNAQFDFLRAILNGVPALDDPNAPPVRRTKRPRSQVVSADAGAEAPAPVVGRPKRPRAPRSPAVRDPAKKEEETLPSPPVVSPPVVSPPVVSPPVVSPPVVVPMPQKKEEDDDDYDECDEDMDGGLPTEPKPTPMDMDVPMQKTEPVTPQHAELPVAPLILQEQPGLEGPRQSDTPVVIRDFGIPPQIKSSDDGERQKVKAAERVSVHALLS